MLDVVDPAWVDLRSCKTLVAVPFFSVHTTFPAFGFEAFAHGAFLQRERHSGAVGTLVARAIRNAIRANRFARIIRN